MEDAEKTQTQLTTKIIIGVRDELRSFAEDGRKEMSVNIYNGLWNIIQGIDHDLEELKK